MHQPPRRTATSVLALGLSLFALRAVPRLGPQNPSLAGTWKLNVEKSDRPEEKIREASRGGDLPSLPEGRSRAGRRGGGGGMRGGGGGGGGEDSAGSGEGGRRASRGGAANMGPLMLYVRPLPQLMVEQTDSTVTVSDPSGTPRSFRPDGRKVSEEMLNGEQLEITARWKNSRLQVERKLGSFGTLKEIYSIDPATKQLVVDVTVSSSQLPRAIEMRRVYDPPAGGM